ncbi:MAG: SDR family oxidoreductase [Nocardiopsaceae bacterium]|nr:SDR family oxidoreductase [Nocardiopsaceae bacterium]
MRTELDGSWCLILGASSGMGRATALEFARQGGNVIGVHFDTAAAQDKVDVLVEELRGHGVRAHFFNANAASPATRKEVVPAITGLTEGAGLRVLLHSLAFGSLVPFIAGEDGPGLTARQMDMTLNVMAHSLVYWTQDLVAAGLLGRSAKIFAMTSAGDEKVTTNYGAVSAAKCALESHVRQLALELAPRGIAVNSLRAGVTVTPSLERIPEHAELTERSRRANPHGRLTTPDDVAEAVCLLARTDSSWITGNIIGVDGGEGLTS